VVSTRIAAGNEIVGVDDRVSALAAQFLVEGNYMKRLVQPDRIGLRCNGCSRLMPRVGTHNTAQTTEQGFRESALQHLNGLYRYATTLARNQAEAEDLVQETYLRAVQAFSHLRPEGNLKSWLFTILRNVRLNQVRDGLNKPRVVEMDEPSGGVMREFEDKSSKDPLFLYLTKVKQADVRKAIEELPAVYREVVVLREFEELSYEEIAHVLDCPPGTVMSRLSRAREKLKEMLHGGCPDFR
jgi:RNA polymerase sigma-70 factor (ECF subfamily)